MPRMFLPLACTANLAKNLAAVTASSTRAPIYRTFAKQNNLADVTAKGGCGAVRLRLRQRGWGVGGPPEAQAARLGCGVGLAPPLARSQPCSRVHACCTPPFPRLPLPRPCCPRCPPVLPTHTAACPTALLHPRCCLPYRATPPCCSPVLPLALAPPVLPLPLPPPVLPLPPPVLPPRRERGQPG